LSTEASSPRPPITLSPVSPPRRTVSLRRESVVLLVLGLLSFLVMVVFRPGVLFIDTRPDVYLDPGALFRESLETWVPGTGLGTTNYDNGYLPIAGFMWVLHALGLPPWLSMRLWRWLLVVVAGLGARKLLVDLTDGRCGTAARLAVAVLFVVNPYVLVGAATTPIMLPYALLPWLLVAIRRSFVSWWWGAALTGLVFFAMGGLNAGVVPAFMLVAVPLVAVDAVRRGGAAWFPVIRGVVASAVACLLVSVYWVVATVTALGTATAVADATEDPRAVAAVSSYGEVLRGLGSWLMYGGDSLGPYRPGFVSYLDNPVTVVASYTLPAIAMLGAWLSRSRLRKLATALMVVGLVLMVGGNPPADPSPFGAALLWGFDHVPGLIAFRTTSKAGALAMLGMAILGALGADVAWARLSTAARGWTVSGVSLMVALSVSPVLIGQLYPGRLDVPDYWQTAAGDLDDRGDAGRVLALPVESNALYRWRPRGVDDFAPVLIGRPVVYTRSFPDGPAGAWNSLAGMNYGVGANPVPGRLLSTYSKYIGATDVLLRNDMLWELMDAPRPAQVVKVAEHDPGLTASALYGQPGENTVRSQSLGPVDAADKEEAKLAPLMRYAVDGASGPVRLFPMSGQLLVAGDNALFPSAVWSRLLDGDTLFRLLPGLDDKELSDSIAAGARIVLTDTNRRHAANDHRLGVSGPLLTADQDATGIRALGDPSEQTVAVYDGIASVSASTSGSVFGPTPTGRPFFALDGDEDTAWTMGDFGTGLGQSITVDLAAPVELTDLTIDRQLTEGARIGAVEVTAGGQTARTTFAAGAESATVRFDGPVTADSVTVKVTRIDGNGQNQVGLREIHLPGVKAREWARMPRLPEQVQIPVDLLLAPSPLEHEETLNRIFTLPAATSYTVRAQLTGVQSPKQWEKCRPLLQVDHQVVRVRAEGEGVGSTITVTGCDVLSLSAGQHRLRKAVPAVINRLYLQAGDPAAHQPKLPDPDWTSDGTSYRVQTLPAIEEQFLVLAEGWDPRWRATIDGQDAGPAMELNGYALGWRLPAGDGHTVVLEFEPQPHYLRALWLSLASVGGCLVLGLTGWVLRRRRSSGMAAG